MTTETSTEPVAPAMAAPVDATTVAQSPAEKMIPQSMVNEIVGSARQKAYSKGSEESKKELDDYFAQKKTEMDAELKASFEQLSKGKSSPKSETPVQSAPDIKALIQETIASENKTRDDAHLRSQQENYVRSQFHELAGKMEATKEKYSDFDEVTTKIDLIKEAPELLVYANGLENAGDVVYNLAKNPGKIGALKIGRASCR